MIVLAASGMATGGRVLHHLKTFIGNSRNLVLFAGYQAPGTRGAVLVAGARSVRIHGQEFEVQAEIGQLEALSAHADADELLAWMGGLSCAAATCVCHAWRGGGRRHAALPHRT